MLSFSIFSDIALRCYLLWTIFYILLVFYLIPRNIYLLKVNNGNTRIKVRNVFKVNNKTVNFNIFYTFVLVFLLLTLNM